MLSISKESFTSYFKTARKKRFFNQVTSNWFLQVTVSGPDKRFPTFVRQNAHVNTVTHVKGFPTGVENMGGFCPPPPPIGWVGGALQNLMRAWADHSGGLKMLLKNTCEGVHLFVMLAISLETWKFTKNELHTYYSRILARF